MTTNLNTEENKRSIKEETMLENGFLQVWQALNFLNNFHLWRCEDADWEIASEGTFCEGSVCEGTVCDDEILFAGLFLGPCLVCGNEFIIYEQVKKHPCYHNNSLCFNKLANMQKLILLVVYYSF